MTIHIDIDTLSRKIAARLRDDDLWTAADVAAYLKCSPRTVSEYYARSSGFPSAVRLPNPAGKRVGDPRYIASEIKKWAQSFKGGDRAGRRRKQ